jgi:hypothetical protein
VTAPGVVVIELLVYLSNPVVLAAIATWCALAVRAVAAIADVPPPATNRTAVSAPAAATLLSLALMMIPPSSEF